MKEILTKQIVYIILKFYIFIWKLMSMIMILGFSLLSLIWTYVLVKMYNFLII